jgi:hypothetical protein
MLTLIPPKFSLGHHPTTSSAALCGNFAPQVRRSKLDVHKVRLRFGSFLRHKIISQIALAELCGDACSPKT